MMIVAAWLAHCIILSAVLAAGALVWELSARWSGRSARWVWLCAMAAAVTLPWLLRLVPERTWPEVVPMVVAAAMSPVVLTPAVAEAAMAGAVDAVGGGWSAVEYALAGWLALSLLFVACVLRVLWSVHRARRRWRPAELDGARVYVTRDMGPAALGLGEGMIVLPAWALELDAGIRSLLLLHEREHVEAGDPRLVIAGLVLVAAMPWNPIIWFHLLRLRNAIELDCDARVLATGVDPRVYGSLLLEVGSRRSRSPFVMATMAEPRVFLEERIRRIARWPLERRRGRSAALAAAALVLFATALSARDPLRPPLLPGTGGAAPAASAPVGEPVDEPVGEPVGELAGAAGSGAGEQAAADAESHLDQGFMITAEDAEPASRRGPARPVNQPPELLNAGEVFRALLDGYPPMLRDAGVGGVAVVWFFVDTDGRVLRTQVATSSSQKALDETALSVASIMRFRPHVRDGQVKQVWVEIPFVFGPGQRIPAQTSRDDLFALPALVVTPPEMLAARDRAAAAPVPLPPPPTAEDITRAPTFTPMTVRPQLQNAIDVQRALVQAYPPVLRDAGISGTPVVWFFIDDSGSVVRTMLSKSSGYPALDEAALRVAQQMRFSPALNRDRTVSVWVEIPVVFTAR
jgi:TonB family protein